MKGLGCTNAINLDGGETADMIYKPKNQKKHVKVDINPVHKFTDINTGNGSQTNSMRPATVLKFVSK